MSTNRLGGGSTKVKAIIKGELRVHTHKSMSEAVDIALKGAADYSRGAPSRAMLDFMIREALTGNAQLPGLVEQADAIIDEAILVDPRLNRKHGWVRAEEGIDADASLVSAGEPNCCLDRRRIKLATESTTQEPVKIVISTDSTDDACDEHVVAFIAAAKLAQQFRPLEIWWQGAWLVDDYSGEVLLAPLIQGDLDFARVQYFLSSKYRDSMSYRCMHWHSATSCNQGVRHNKDRTTYTFGGKRATQSYLPDTFDFIRETGIKSDPQYIADLAARWAGLESQWHTRIDDSGAEQWWRDRSQDRWEPSTETAKERAERQARWAREERERERQRKAEAEKRHKLAA